MPVLSGTGAGMLWCWECREGLSAGLGSQPCVPRYDTAVIHEQQDAAFVRHQGKSVSLPSQLLHSFSGRFGILLIVRKWSDIKKLHLLVLFKKPKTMSTFFP